VDAFERGVQIGALDARFVKLVEMAMKTVGLELARNVLAGERGVFCVPAQVAKATDVDPGAVLLLEDRVVIAWSEGIFRPRPHSLAWPLADVSDMRIFKRKAGKLSARLDAIAFSAHGCNIEVILHSEVAHNRLVAMVAGVLDGSISFDWNESQDVTR
jgi:hypothetical protein